MEWVMWLRCCVIGREVMLCDAVWSCDMVNWKMACGEQGRNTTTPHCKVLFHLHSKTLCDFGLQSLLGITKYHSVLQHRRTCVKIFRGRNSPSQHRVLFRTSNLYSVAQLANPYYKVSFRIDGIGMYDSVLGKTKTRKQHSVLQNVTPQYMVPFRNSKSK